MNAPLYRSQTRSIPIPSLPSSLRNALLTYADTKKLKMVGAQAWLTHRENPAATTLLGKLLKKRANAGDLDAEHDLLIVVHATHVLVGASGASRGTKVHGVPLTLATVTRDHGADGGLTIGGFPGDASTHFVGLAAGPDADACVQALTSAIEAAKRPAD